MPSLIGTLPNQVPTNALLGPAAYMQPEQILTTGSGITTIASASVTDIGTSASQVVSVTGTTTITSLGDAKAGAERTLVFTAALTLTHNATSLILPGGANVLTAAGDSAQFVALGSGNWKCISYQPAVDRIATQAEAEAGISNSVLMTPSRVKQAIDFTFSAKPSSYPVIASGTLTDKNGRYGFLAATTTTLPDLSTSAGFSIFAPTNAPAVPTSVTTPNGWSIQTSFSAGTYAEVTALITGTPHALWLGRTMTPPTLASLTAASNVGGLVCSVSLSATLFVLVYYITGGNTYAVAFDSSTDALGTPVILTGFTSTVFMNIYADSSTTFVCVTNQYTIAGSVSGTTITLGTRVTLNSSSNNCAIKLADNLYVVSSDGSQNMQAFSVSGTTITAGTAVSTGGFAQCRIARATNTTFVMVNLNTGGGASTRQLSARVGSISGTTITLNTAATGTNIIANAGINVLAAFSEGSSYFVVCQDGTTSSTGDWYGITVSGTTTTLGTVSQQVSNLPASDSMTGRTFTYVPAKASVKYNGTTWLFGHLATGPIAVTISGTTLTFGTSGGPATTVNFLTDVATGSIFYAVGASDFDKLSVSGSTITSSWQVAASPKIVSSDTLTDKVVSYGGTWYTWTIPSTIFGAVSATKWLRYVGTTLQVIGPMS